MGRKHSMKEDTLKMKNIQWTNLILPMQKVNTAWTGNLVYRHPQVWLCVKLVLTIEANGIRNCAVHSCLCRSVWTTPDCAKTGTVLKLSKQELHKFGQVDSCSVSIYRIRYLRLLSGVRQLFIQIWICIWNAYLIHAMNVMEFKDGKFKIKFLTYLMENIWTALYFFFFSMFRWKNGLHTFVHILPAMKEMNTSDWTAFGFHAEPKWVQNTNATIKALQLQPFVSFEDLFTVRLEGLYKPCSLLFFSYSSFVPNTFNSSLKFCLILKSYII